MIRSLVGWAEVSRAMSLNMNDWRYTIKPHAPPCPVLALSLCPPSLPPAVLTFFKFDMGIRCGTASLASLYMLLPLYCMRSGEGVDDRRAATIGVYKAQGVDGRPGTLRQRHLGGYKPLPGRPT